ncbi:MAG: hypothetical protein SFT93_01180 [Rickettsiaceae bacterium]|nr:hypothetical protein [Rickettsiaceae bacterium]
MQYNYVMLYMGKQISLHQENLEDISAILGNIHSEHYKMNKLFAWTSFDWLDKNNIRIVSQIKGIDKSKVDYSHRSYTEDGRATPWVLHFSEKSIGITGGNLVIPLGMGITDANGEFAGTLAGGLDIIALSRMLESKITDEYSFIIFSKALTPALYSSNIYPEKLDMNLFLPLKKIGESDKDITIGPIHIGDVTYSSFKKIPQSPFIVATGIQSTIFWKGYISLLLPYIIALFCASLFTILMIHISNSRTTQITHISDAAERRFYGQIEDEFKSMLKVVMHHSDLVLRCFKGEIDVGITRKQQIEMLSIVHDSVVKMYNATIDQSSVILVNINNIINDAVLIKYKSIMHKRVYLKTNLQPDLPELRANIIGIKQIILGLLSLAIETSLSGGLISISTFFNKDTDSINITIKDNGLAIAEQDISRIRSIFGSRKNNINATNLELSNIITLIEDNKGLWNIIEELGKGRIVSINFSLENNKQFNT